MSAVHAGGRATDDTPETVMIMEQVPLTGFQELSAGLVLPVSSSDPTHKVQKQKPMSGPWWLVGGVRAKATSRKEPLPACVSSGLHCPDPRGF